MTKPDGKSRSVPADRLRAILHGINNEESPMDRLPRAKPVEDKSMPKTVPIQAPPASVPQPPAVKPRSHFLPAFWTIASILSMTVNIILLVALVFILYGLGGLNLGQMGTGLLGGLYTNFERMDAAHIKTVIPIQKDIPVSLNVCIQTGTNVVLNQDTTIDNAKVTVQTGGLNIQNASTIIILPAKTNLPVNLDLCVPVNTTVKVAMNVNVDIPLASTDLHPAILGLENTIKPWYCLVNADAVSIHNVPVCR
jgi:hypothetical protein